MWAKNLFEELENFNLFFFKYYMFDHFVEDLSWVTALNFMSEFLSELFIYILVKFINMTSTRCFCVLEEAVKANTSAANAQRRNSTSGVTG